MPFANVYEDAAMADAYSRLEFPGTYFLAYRDLPAIIAEHVKGTRALDFGCGSGRSTRFLRRRGFDATGIDISQQMLERARAIDPAGDYRLVSDTELSLSPRAFDLILSAFTFDNVPTSERKVELFRALGRALRGAGTIVNLVSSPEIYLHEWASFSTRDFLAENEKARRGDIVRIINTAIDDRRPVDDVLWPDDAYRETFAQAGLELLATYRPLGRADESQPWVNETRIAPWTIYVLGRPAESQ